MSKEIKNSKAFPLVVDKDINFECQEGMTLSNYFEAKAMQALIASNFIKNGDGFADVRYDYDELASLPSLYDLRRCLLLKCTKGLAYELDSLIHLRSVSFPSNPAVMYQLKSHQMCSLNEDLAKAVLFICSKILQETNPNPYP